MLSPDARSKQLRKLQAFGLIYFLLLCDQAKPSFVAGFQIDSFVFISKESRNCIPEYPPYI